MRLSANFIVNYANVNQFAYQDQWKIRAGDPVTLYFQLVDLDQNQYSLSSTSLLGGPNNATAALRYMVGIGSSNQPASIVVTCPSIDNSKVLQFVATQADPNDASIWKIQIAPTQIPSSGNVIFMVIEGSNKRSFNKMNALAVELPGADGSC